MFYKMESLVATLGVAPETVHNIMSELLCVKCLLQNLSESFLDVYPLALKNQKKNVILMSKQTKKFSKKFRILTYSHVAV